LNSSEAIKLSSNKKLAREVLASFGVPTPEASETDFPIIARPSYHEQGNDLFVCYDEYDIEEAKERGCTYFSRYYPKTKEYRVHVGSDKTLLVSVKENGDTESIVWNYHKTGFNLRHLHRSDWLYDETLHDIVRMAKKAVRVLGLDFGSVDIMAYPTDDQPIAVVSEVNTSSSLSPLAMNKYLDYFFSVMG
jgi:carbamoylphosphate synthase large subunit